MSGTWRSSHVGTSILEWLVARRTGNLILLVMFMVPMGTVGYMLVEGLDLLDAVYQTMITLSTVGYQDLVTTPAGRIFSILFMAVGVGLFVIMLSSLAAFLVEGRLREAIGRRRMERDIQDLRGHIILCGLGRWGLSTAVELQKRGVDFAVLDLDPTVIDQADQHGILALHADATEEKSLARAGIEHARGVISTLDSDAANVYVALTAKQMRPDISVVTVARELHAESKLRAAGADVVISPYALGAVDLTRRMLQPHVSQFLAGAGGGARFGLEEIPVRAGSPLVNVQLKDARLRQKYAVTIIAIVKSREESIQDHPQPDTTIEAGDILIAVGAPDGLAKLSSACASPRT